MDERDKEIQVLRRQLDAVVKENDALMGELYNLKECSTCIHYDEKYTLCRDEKHISCWCRPSTPYVWRGVNGYNKWVKEQEKYNPSGKEE